MFCRQCGKEIIESNMEKCPSCNARLGKGRRFCPICGTQNKHNDTICDNCGFDFSKPTIENKPKTNNNTTNVKKEVPVVSSNKVEEPQVSGNSLADKIMSANNGRTNAFASYGKNQVLSPLSVPTDKPKNKHIDRFSGIDTKPEPKLETAKDNEIFPKEPIKNKEPVEMVNKENLKDKHVDELLKKSNNFKINNKSPEMNAPTAEFNAKNKELDLDVWLLLVVIFSIATVCTCQVVYGACSLLFSIISFISKKNKKPLIISLLTLLAMFVAIYFGISFYLI